MKLEYEAIMRKMSEVRADLSRTETIYPLAMAAIYAWVLTQPAAAKGPWILALALAPLIGALGFLRIVTRQKTMELLERYCSELEKEFYAGASPKGWEHVYGNERPMKRFAVARLWIGGIIVAASVLLSLYAIYDPAALTPPAPAAVSER